MKYNRDTLLTYCNENNITLVNYYNDNVKRDSYIDLKCIHCSNEFTKNFRQVIKTGAYCQICMNQISNNKIRESKVKYNINMLSNFCDEYNNVFEKQKSAKDLGLKYEIWIFNKSGQLLDKHI